MIMLVSWCVGIGTACGAFPRSAADVPTTPAEAKEYIFAVRQLVNDPHWYANFGYFAQDENRKAYGKFGQLCAYDVASGAIRAILDDPEGAVRDPQVGYDGRKILFSYRKGGTDHYHLYEINLDGSGLRQITSGPYDDIEPTYMPDGGIMFCSSRCNRWVNCWQTKVAILCRCAADGSNLHPVSGNTEHDNTPWPLLDGRVLYTRWEYIDRSQVHYHHLWAMNPDGTGQMVYYGNFHPGILMIDAKPIPGTQDIVSIFSPGHGRREHAGAVTIVSPKTGPDDKGSARQVGKAGDVRDPYPLSAETFLVVRGPRLIQLKADGSEQELYRLPKELSEQNVQIHEPRPVYARRREPVIPPRADLAQTTGHLVVEDVYAGRKMDGVNRGDIKKLLVLEPLPMPIHYMGGMSPISLGGTFTLERVLGTVPVESDGSAYMELPALRSLFFVALDENDNSVKRMQSFLSIMPGERTSCVGCHEPRTQAPTSTQRNALQALQRPPSTITPVPGIPDVYDFPRDIQPVLDRHCVKCHDVPKPSGGVLLDGGRGPMYTHSYYTLTMRRQVADGRNQPKSNLAPRTIGAVASPLMKKLTGGHHKVNAPKEDVERVRYWIEAGGAYPGTYAALSSGMIGWSSAPKVKNTTDTTWAESKAAAEAVSRRCAPCHKDGRRLPRYLSEDRARGRFSRHLVFNLTTPERSMMVLAPLSKEAGGAGVCATKGEGDAQPVPVFADTSDPDYVKILAMCQAGKRRIEANTRFDMDRYIALPSYMREMRHYGVLDASVADGTPINPHETDRRYWESLHWRPERAGASAN
ncbi:MAG: hypothetical protein GY851_21045 [bacterium]|nr:hypothetical protein [bacterium]